MSCVSVKPGYFKDDEKSAVESVQQFHDLLNQEEYEKIYALTDQRAKETKGKDPLIAALKTVHLYFGKVLKTERIDSKVSLQASYRQVDLLYRTTFEKGQRMEKFVWYVNDGKAGLYSYSQPENTP